MSVLQLSHPDKIVKGLFKLPTSKSISNRLLIMQSLFPDKISIKELSEADDTKILQSALLLRSGTVDVKNAGTCLRFLTAFYSCVPCDVVLHGSKRLHQRPVGDLVDALRQIGADIDYIDQEGFAPLRIKGKKLTGGAVTIDASKSSQHVSALMLIAPVLENGLTIAMEGDKSSVSYILMTERVMFDCGLMMSREDDVIDIPKQNIQPKEITVEADWSAASYWYEMASLSRECEIILPGLLNSGTQGDMVISTYMERLGVHTEFHERGVVLRKNANRLSDVVYDMTHEPDLVPAMAAAMATAGVKAEFKGIKNLRIKESDRIASLEQELTSCGYDVSSTEQSIRLLPSEVNYNQSVDVETYGDHRIAMAFAPLALKFNQVNIHDPEVVEKSYPMFWEELKKAGFHWEIKP